MISLRSLVARPVLSAARSTWGSRVVGQTVKWSMTLTVDVAPDASFAGVECWPERLAGFEDLDFLFTSTPLDYGIAQLRFDEAAFLYRTARNAPPGVVAEIGRYRGGSTLLLAAAVPEGGRVVSYDAYAVPGVDGAALDAELSRALDRYGLLERVELAVADSKTVAPPGECEVVLVDGDHTYEGVRADYDHWKTHVVAGGHLLFHDAPDPTSATAVGCEPVGRLVREIERDDRELFRRAGQVGSIAHFIRTGDR